jgi:hypothetical protein
MVNDRVWEEGYAVGVQDSMLRATQYERILTDLIEHLRAWERSQRIDPVHNPDYLAWIADRAEAHLREVTGDE